jgi:hypothetical protein
MSTVYTHIPVNSNSPFYGRSTAIDLLKKEKDQENFVIFLEHLWEHNIQINLPDISIFIQTIKEARPNWKIFLLMNEVDRYYYDQALACRPDDILCIEYFIYFTWQHIVVNKVSSIATRVSFDKTPTDKFLFLLGKAAKPNRIRLLKKFVDAGLVDQCSWSLYYFDDQQLLKQKLKDQLPELSNAEFDTFIKTYARQLDNVQMYKDYKEYEFNSVYYDVNLYSRTDFSVVAETTFSNKPVHNPWVTEKTWKAILNQHPFILAADVGGLQYIKSLGFETYNHMLAVPHYDEICNVEERLAAIITNTNHWLNGNYHQLQAEIAHYNLTRLEELYDENYAKIVNFQSTHNLTDIPLDKLVPIADRYFEYSDRKRRDTLFVSFYNNIKDSSWPAVTGENDFAELPAHIQQECVDVFGYIPSNRK